MSLECRGEPRRSVPVRLALIGLARGPLAPSLAIAFLAITTSVGGFALSLRATISRASSSLVSVCWSSALSIAFVICSCSALVISYFLSSGPGPIRYEIFSP